MKTCIKCKKEFDASMICEDVEMLEALDRYVDIGRYCSDCLETLDDSINIMLAIEVTQ